MDRVYLKESEPFGVRWDKSCTEAFQKIISCLTHANPQPPDKLHVDASLKGLGAVVYQNHPEGLRSIAFASRKLSAAERNCPIHQLEFVSLKWAVVDKFHDYLYGARFTVHTDNNPLIYVLSTAKLSAVGQCWLFVLSTYEFDIQYQPGLQNVETDLLSRNWPEMDDDGWVTILQPGVKTICQKVGILESVRLTPLCVAQLGASPDSVPDLYAYPTNLDLKSLELMCR